MSREVEFVKDFATKKVGQKFICDSGLANTLVRHDKVAKYTDVERQKRLEKLAKDEDKREKDRQAVIKQAQKDALSARNKRLISEAKSLKEKEEGEKALIEKYIKPKK